MSSSKQRVLFFIIEGVYDGFIIYFFLKAKAKLKKHF
jgi:hypothetical protein